VARRVRKAWCEYPLGTKAYHYGGGHWVRVEHGWKWCSGSTFPTPGAGVIRVAEPEQVEPTALVEAERGR